MPVKKAAFKARRASAKRQLHNQAMKTRMKNTNKKLLRALQQNNSEAANKIAAEYIKALDKAAQSKVMKKNTVNRAKALVAKKLKSVKQTSPS
ncbi:30S ribosomal protein S20 [Patescibacteria group bacterium]